MCQWRGTREERQRSRTWAFKSDFLALGKLECGKKYKDLLGVLKVARRNLGSVYVYSEYIPKGSANGSNSL